MGQPSSPHSILLLPTKLSLQMPCSYSFSTRHSKMGSFLFRQREGRRRYYQDGLCRFGWSQSRYMPVVIHECGHLKAAHSWVGPELSSHARRPSGWSHSETTSRRPSASPGGGSCGWEAAALSEVVKSPT